MEWAARLFLRGSRQHLLHQCADRTGKDNAKDAYDGESFRRVLISGRCSGQWCKPTYAQNKEYCQEVEY